MLWSKVTYCTEKWWTQNRVPCLSLGCQRRVTGNRKSQDGSKQTNQSYPLAWRDIVAAPRPGHTRLLGNGVQFTSQVKKERLLSIHSLFKILHDRWVLNLPKALFMPHRNFKGHVPVLDLTCFHRLRHLTCLPAKLSVVCVPEQGLTFDIKCAFKAHISVCI